MEQPRLNTLLLPLMTIGHKAGHYCHFRIQCSVDTGRKKWFGIYWQGDDTFHLKVPWVGDRTASGGIRSSPWLCGGRCCFGSPCGSWSVGIGDCGDFFFHLQAIHLYPKWIGHEKPCCLWPTCLFQFHYSDVLSQVNVSWNATHFVVRHQFLCNCTNLTFVPSECVMKCHPLCCSTPISL